MKRIVGGIVVAIVVLVTPLVLAQEEKKEKGHVFSVSTYKVPFQNIDGVVETWEEFWRPINAKNEHVKSMRVFTHLYGSDWTILVVTEYESLSAIDAASKRGQEIRKEIFPDDDEWQAVLAETQGTFMGHTDNLVVEVPSLRK